MKDKNIFIKNIYYMLAYAFDALSLSGFENASAEEFDNMHNLFAAVLGRGIARQLKRGLYREYTDKVDASAAVRGRIDMPGTIRNQTARRRMAVCRYDELSENNLPNQIIKTTAMLLIRHSDADASFKDDLKKEMLYFSNVDMLNPALIRWNSLQTGRNSREYRMLLGICRLLMDGMLMTTDNGGYKLASYADEQHMCRLYEKFILEYYIKEFPMLKAGASQIPWAVDNQETELLPRMQSDIMLSYGNNVLIIDAKYYSHTTQVQYDVHTLHSANLYQIFTYVKNKDAQLGGGLHTVSGMLLYARTDEALQPDNTYIMGGNRISVRTLDLNCEFKDIAAQLNNIAGEHFGITK